MPNRLCFLTCLLLTIIPFPAAWADTILEDDFEGDPDLNSRYDDVSTNGMFVTNTEALTGTHCLEQHYNIGQVNAGWISAWNDETGFPEHIFQRWYHKFESGFSGYPPKMARIRYRPHTGPDAWNEQFTVHCWLAPVSGEVVIDVLAIHSTQANSSGWLPVAGTGFTFADPANIGRWVCFEVEAKLNTPGGTDGHYRLWIDDVLVVERLNVDLRGSTTDSFNDIMLDCYWNAGSPRDQSRYYDAYKVATERVGMLGNNPTAGDDSASTDEDVAVIISVLSNDTDPYNAVLTVSQVSDGSHGTVTTNGTTVTYTPDPDYHGTDSFTYTAEDGTGDADTAMVTVTIAPLPDPPSAVDDEGTTDEDTQLTIAVMANDSDPDGDSLSISVVGSAAHGTAVINTTTITYTPQADYHGSDTFTYTISDGNGGTDTATVTVTINPVNDSPAAGADTAVTDEDTAVVITVLDNDTDPDGDSLTIAAAGPAWHGTVTDDGSSITYTPDTDYSGTDSFTYTIIDSHGGTDTATVTVTVSSVNDAPAAYGRSVQTASNASVDITLTAYDADGDTLTYTIIDRPIHGSLTGDDGDASATYIPDAMFTGADSFTFSVSDGIYTSNTAVVSIAVDDALISLISVSSGRDYSLGTAAPGCLYFIDRSYTIAGLSSELEDGILIRTANDDKGVSRDEHLAFSVTDTVIAAVCYDPRCVQLPDWLDDGTWTLTAGYVDVPSLPGSPLSVYEKTFMAGTVILGGNPAAPAESVPSNYVVIVRPLVPGPALFVPGPLAADTWEHANDSDGDGLTDLFEDISGLNAADIDTDSDDLVDEEEDGFSGFSYWQEQEAYYAALNTEAGDTAAGCMPAGPAPLLPSILVLIGCAGAMAIRRRMKPGDR